jgi:hypothetical protein
LAGVAGAAAIDQGFGNMKAAHRFATIEIGNGAG